MMSNAKQPSVKNWLSYRLSKTQAKLNTQASRMLKRRGEFSLTEYRLCSVLAEQRDAIGTVELAQLVGSDNGLVSRALKSLVVSGWVSGHQLPTDKRNMRYELTDVGREKLSLNQVIMAKRRDALSQIMTESERALFYDILDRIEAITECDFE